MKATAMDELDLLVEAAAVAGQLDAGLNAKFVAAKSALGSRGVSVLANAATPSRRNRAPDWSTDDERFMAAAIGVLSEREIGDALGRSPWAIRVRRRRIGIVAASRRPDEMTCEQVAIGIGLDGHQVAQLIDRGILPGRRLPFEGRTIRVVERITLLRWLVNPENWCYFKTERVGRRYLKYQQRRACAQYDRAFWKRARRLVSLRRARWNDEWWTPRQVARSWGFDDPQACCVNNAIHRGWLPAKRWANWWIKRSDATNPQLRRQRWTGRGGPGQDHDEWSPRADAFIVLAWAVGLEHAEIAVLMGWKQKRVEYRMVTLRRRQCISDIIREHDLPVRLTPDGKLCADWRAQAHRFPHFARRVEKLLAKPVKTNLEARFLTLLARKVAGAPAVNGKKVRRGRTSSK